MTMAFFNSSSPVYKTAAAPNAIASAPSSGASLFGSLIGGSTPVYKTLDGQAGQAPASSGMLQIFVGSAPSYKTAPQTGNSDVPDSDGGDADDTDDGSASCPLPTDTVVVL
jgi:hypothetical protein